MMLTSCSIMYFHLSNSSSMKIGRPFAYQEWMIKDSFKSIQISSIQI